MAIDDDEKSRPDIAFFPFLARGEFGQAEVVSHDARIADVSQHGGDGTENDI